MDLILDKIDENFSKLVLKDESFLCLTPFDPPPFDPFLVHPITRVKKTQRMLLPTTYYSTLINNPLKTNP